MAFKFRFSLALNETPIKSPATAHQAEIELIKRVARSKGSDNELAIAI